MFGFRIPELGWDEGSGQGQAGLQGLGAKQGSNASGRPRVRKGESGQGVSVVLKVGCKVESSEGL